MSYSGFWEWLCEAGHYVGHDCMDDKPSECPHCGKGMAWWHSVDQTNGYDESHEATCRAPTRLIAADDEWHVDHLGNRFATQRQRLAPNSKAWKRVRHARAIEARRVAT